MTIAAVRPRTWRPSEPGRQMLAEYLARCSKTHPATFEEFRSEEAFWDWVERRRGRASFVALADRGGRPFDSEELARELAQVRDRGTPHVIVGVGPADGWSAESLRRANLRLSFGPLTLPHELAAIVAAEQLYRVTAIWAGHPYHGGH